MSVAPYRVGDFVWCSFPERENPARPGPQHVAYVLATASSATHSLTALIAYTSSRPWLHEPKPLGLLAFDAREAVALGQSRAFVLDLRRMAFVPVTPAWFPRLGLTTGDGVQGRAPLPLQQTIQQLAARLLGAPTTTVERLGPLWP